MSSETWWVYLLEPYEPTPSTCLYCCQSFYPSEPSYFAGGSHRNLWSSRSHSRRPGYFWVNSKHGNPASPQEAASVDPGRSLLWQANGKRSAATKCWMEGMSCETNFYKSVAWGSCCQKMLHSKLHAPPGWVPKKVMPIQIPCRADHFSPRNSRNWRLHDNCLVTSTARFNVNLDV